MVVTASSRRAGRVNNKTKLLVVRGSNSVDLAAAETIVWDDPSSSSNEPSKHQHVGAKGVESGEFLEHHLQAALSSSSLLHSGPARPSSPTSSSSRQPQKAAEASSSTSHAILNYHIPTPDATGLVESANYAKLYQTHRYHEPHGYIRFSDTVEESSCGHGGLGYCMDDEDEEWLKNFNSKGEGSSNSVTVQSPLKEAKADNSMGPPSSSNRPRREKGKEKEKEADRNSSAPIFISEDSFEFVMGVLEKHTEDKIPTLDVDLSRLPTFASLEHLFSSPLPASFFPNFEIPRDIPSLKELTRQARCIYPHWKERRLARKGKTIFPMLNFDDTNDGDPYVCFRRRDMRQTRKARRTDNLSVERMQKLQLELRSAHQLVQLVQRREVEKKASYKVDREVWEAKWKLFETKRRWPSLGLSREEEEIITGRHSRESTMAAGVATVNASMLGGREALQAQRENLPTQRKKVVEKDREERDKRDRGATEAQRLVEKAMAFSGGRSYAPDAMRERMQALRDRLEAEIAKRKVADADWDDMTDSSYQPFPSGHGSHAFRPLTALDSQAAFAMSRSSDDDESSSQPLSFRLRRGRGGILRLDRRDPSQHLFRRPSSSPKSPACSLPWLNGFVKKAKDRRPKSIDDLENMASSDEEDEDIDLGRVDEAIRYNVDSGGAVGVGMGITDNDENLVIDDLDPKYIRHRITLLRDDDVEKLRPDMTKLAAALQTLDVPEELPRPPIFNKPQIQQINPQMMAQIQQHQMFQQQQQQQQMEQFQRYQIIAQQQAMQQAAMAQAQAQAQAHAHAQAQAQAQMQQQQPQQNGHGPVRQRVGSSSESAAGSPSVNGQPQNGKPPNNRRLSSQSGNGANGNNVNGVNGANPGSRRASLSPTNSMKQSMNGQSPQMVNGMMVPPGTKGNFLSPQQMAAAAAAAVAANGHGQQMDPALQQRILAARALAAQQAQNRANGMMQDANGMAVNGTHHDGSNHQMDGHVNTNMNGMNGQPTPEQLELLRLTQQAGLGNNIGGYLEARNKAKLLSMAKQAQQQQQQAQMQQQQVQMQQNGGGTPQQHVSMQSGGSQVPRQSTPQQQQQQQAVFNTPSPAQMQLKLPAHAAARLGATAQQGVPASPAQQRAS